MAATLENAQLMKALESVSFTGPSTEHEATIFCPACMTFETVWFLNGKLGMTRKFVQVDDRLYHDCGTSRPCLVYRPR